MQPYISKFITNDNNDFEYIQVVVTFVDDTSPHQCADVAVFVEKAPDKTLDELKTDAIQKAEDYLQSILDGC